MRLDGRVPNRARGESGPLVFCVPREHPEPVRGYPGAGRRIAIAAAFLAIFTMLLAAPAAPTFPGPNGKIFFVLNDGTYNQIYKVNPNGSGLEPVTDDNAGHSDPAISPNGRRVAFSRAEGMGTTHIFITRTTGTVERQITKGAPAIDPTWTASGKKIVYTRFQNSNYDLFIVGVGDDPRVGRRLTETPGYESAPEVSPNGKWVAFTFSTGKGQAEIVKMRLDGTGRQRLTDTDNRVESDPTWAPNGNRIAFSFYGMFEDVDVASIRATGSGRENLTRTDDVSEDEPSWSPNGEWIAAGALRISGSDRRIVRFRSNDGRPLRKVTTYGTGGSQPAWNIARN